MSSTTSSQHTLHLDLGHDELVIRRRYETLSIVNDVLLGLEFLVGSFLFMSDSTATAGTWLFIVGSVQMLIRPTIRLVRRIHLTRRNGPGGHESSQDF